MIHDYLQEKIDASKEILKLAAEMSMEYYHKPLICTYSGGKDSDVLIQLAIECLAPSEFEVLNSHTTVDAPETVYYIRERFKDFEEKGIKTEIRLPRDKDGKLISMWSLIEKKMMPPTRLARYCCQELKETSTPNRLVALGVRAEESTGRKGRNVFGTRGNTKKEAYYYYSHTKEVFKDDKERRAKEGIQNNNELGVYDCRLITKAKLNEDLICNPIYYWTDSDVWRFIEDRNMPHNPLYDKGFKRVGCIGCPLARMEQKRALQLYPKYKQNYINAFDRMLKKRKAQGKDDSKGRWRDAEHVYKWWIEDDTIDGQMNIYDFLEKEDDGN